jgi:ABC-type uncharacterized transport system substrate-binding protein
MRVSGFLALLVLGILVAPLVSEAQPRAKIPQVGFLHHSRQADERQLRRLEAFRHGLGDLGYVEGQSILLEVRWSEGHLDRLAELAADLVRRQVDVLVAYGPQGIRAARDATRTIPIVMARMDDADEHGFVASLARPGGNITGLSFQTGALSGKWLALLKDTVPSLARVAVLWGIPRAPPTSAQSWSTPPPPWASPCMWLRSAVPTILTARLRRHTQPRPKGSCCWPRRSSGCIPHGSSRWRSNIGCR